MKTRFYPGRILTGLQEAVCLIDYQYRLVYSSTAVEELTGRLLAGELQSNCSVLCGKESCWPNCPLREVITGSRRFFFGDEAIYTAGGVFKPVLMIVLPWWEAGKIEGALVFLLERQQDLDLNKGDQEQVQQRETSRHRRLEKALRRSEAMYRAMFEYTGTAMLVIGADRTILMANRELETMTGYKREEIVGKRKWDEFIHPEDRERMLQYHARRREEGGLAPKQYEFRLLDAHGSVREIFFTIGMIPGTSQSIGSMLDITERKQMEKRLRESEERYRLLLRNIEDVFYEVDYLGNFTFVSDAVQRVFGFKKKELLGKNYKKLVDTEEDARKIFAAYNKVYVTGQPERGVSWAITGPDGERRELEVSVSPIKNAEGDVVGFRGIARDITERKQAEDRLRYLSMHDPLTGLYNRACFEEEMLRLEKGRRYPVSLICGDVDGLKFVNDTMGHKKGDELLVAAAQTIRSPLRADDVVARVGGDEFVVILPETGEAEVKKVYLRIKEAVALYNERNPRLPLRISLGWATANSPVEMKDLFKRADDDMYREKLHNASGGKQNIYRTIISILRNKLDMEEKEIRKQLMKMLAGDRNAD